MTRDERTRKDGHTLNLWVKSPELFEALKKAAMSEDRSVSNIVVRYLKASLKKDGYLE